MTKKIFLIAGEASGDALGAGLIRVLKSADPAIEFSGVGGPLMEAEGFKSQRDMNELCVMGLWEIMGHLPRLLRLIGAMAEEIEQFQPDAVVTIDLPDFNFQVAQKLKKRGKTRAKIIHYVAPSVWAWRPGRAKKIAKFLDGLMCLFPFEPPYFAPHGLRAEYVGHPVAENCRPGDGAGFREFHKIPADAKTLGLFFGSRPSEIEKMGEILRDVAAIIKEQRRDLHLIVPTLKSVEYEVFKQVAAVKCPSAVLTNPAMKWDAFAACDAAVAVSGTVGLELAYAGVPHVITYKMHPATWAAVKILAKTKYAHLGNILLNEPAFPEFLQGRADPLKIAKAVLRLYQIEEERKRQADNSARLRAIMAAGGDGTPSEKAAGFVVSFLSS